MQATEQEYLSEVLRTYAGPDDLRQKLTLAALGLTGESGEVADHLKKHLFQEHPLDLNHLKQELGDVLWYLTLACQACGFSLTDVMTSNIEKLRRRYPDGFDPARSMHRDSIKEGIDSCK